MFRVYLLYVERKKRQNSRCPVIYKYNEREREQMYVCYDHTRLYWYVIENRFVVILVRFKNILMDPPTACPNILTH
jgi:hypothetical protein